MNVYQPHVLVLPEDDANRQLVNGFQLLADVHANRLKVLPPAGGWPHVIKEYLSVHASEMRRFPARHMVLLVDGDGSHNHINTVREAVGTEFQDRTFVLGVRTEPEDLRKDEGSYEDLGRRLAVECRDDVRDLWNHDLLAHNAAELDRLTEHLSPVLFG